MFFSLLIFFLYGNALSSGLVSDDWGIIKNIPTQTIASLVKLPYYNTLRPLLYIVVYALAGPSPSIFRLTNVVFHIGVTCLIFFMLRKFINPPTALLAATLFAVHPIAVESVTWISGGVYAQYTFFALLSLYLYAVFGQDKRYYFLSVLCFLFAVFSSEKAVVFSAVFILYDFSFGSLRRTWKRLFPFVIVSAISGALLVSNIGKRQIVVQNVFYQNPGGIENPLIQVPQALTGYFKLIFWPDTLTFYHVLDAPDMVTTFINTVVTLGLFLTVVVSYRKNRHIFFWLLFFVITLLPVLTPFRISWQIAERYVYAGSIGIFAFIATAVTSYRRLLPKQILLTIIVVVLIALSVRTVKRNTDWKNEETLFLSMEKTSPNLANVRLVVGVSFGQKKEYERAIDEFKTAIALNPGVPDGYFNLGITYERLGNPGEAINYYLKGLEKDPTFWWFHRNLAELFFRQKKYTEAIDHLKSAIRIEPTNGEQYVNLGIVYRAMGNEVLAQQTFQKSLLVDPNNIKIQQYLKPMQSDYRFASDSTTKE